MNSYEYPHLLSINHDLIYDKCCQIIDSRSDIYPYPPQTSSSSDKILHMHFDAYINIIDEVLLQELVSNYDYLSLTISNPTHYTSDKLSLLAQYISLKLVYLKIEDCASFTWKNHVKILLSPSNRLEIIDMPRNLWVDDHCIEQIISKFHRTLRCIILEDCKISNECLILVGRRCVHLKSLHLSYCTMIHDKGIISIASRLRLTHIRISHNHHISDNGISELLRSSSQLVSLSLINCNNITDDGIMSIHPSLSSSSHHSNKMMMKKSSMNNINNNYHHSLTSLTISSNPNISASCLYDVALSSSSLRSLDLRECTNINLTSGMSEFNHIKLLSSIYVGPSSHPLQSETFMHHLLYHSHYLTSLYLDALPDIKESDLIELIFSSPNIDDMHLCDISCGTATIEAIINSIPHLAKLSIIGSMMLADKDVRSLSMICVDISSLCLRRCSSLSKHAFNRIMMMKKLSYLDISSCANINDASFISLLSGVPIHHLIIDHLDLDVNIFISSLSSSSLIHTISHLSLQRCSSLNRSSYIIDILHLCVYCQSINIMDVPVPVSSLQALSHHHPFLSYVNRSSFVGYEISSYRRSCYEQYYDRIMMYKKYHAVRLMMRLYRRYRCRLDEYKVIRRQEWISYQHHATIIQKMYRSYIIYKHHHEDHHQHHIDDHDDVDQMIIAQQHHRCIIYRKYFSSLFRHRISSHHILASNNDMIISKQDMMMKKKIFTMMKNTSSHDDNNDHDDHHQHHNDDVHQHHDDDDMLYDHAVILWEENICRMIISHWKRILHPSHSSRHHRHRLLSIFNNCIDISYHNSSRQRSLYHIACKFHHRRLLITAYMCFSHDLVRIREVELLYPKAIMHHHASFKERIIHPVFHAMIWYRNYRRQKHDHYNLLMKKRHMKLKIHAFLSYHHYHHHMHYQHVALRNARLSYRHNMYHKFISCIIPYHHHIHHMKTSYHKADKLHHHMQRRSSFAQWISYHIQRKQYHIMNRRAKRLARYHMISSSYIIMKRYRQKKAVDEDELLREVYHRYLLSLCHKIIDAFKQHVMEVHAYKAQLAENILRRNISIDNHDNNDEVVIDVDDDQKKQNRMNKFHSCIISLQAIIRSKIQQKRYHTYRIQALYATLIIQRCIRRYLAVRRVKDIYRKRQLREQIREYDDNDRMREADEESMYYEYLIHCIIIIQTCYRGFRGRDKVVQIKIANTRYRAQQKYQDMMKIRHEYEHYQRLATIRENNRQRAACLIQRITRGYLARKYYKNKKYMVIKNKSSIIIQAQYRRRLASQHVSAIIRDRASRERFFAARKRRGYVLRSFGFKTRKVQHQVAKFLKFVGIDPLSYHYRLSEVFHETSDDFLKFYKQMILEWNILGSNFIEKNRIRRQFAINGKYHFQINDAVRIIEADHQYFGYTGVIVRIDTSMAGIPLYEIKLDRYAYRQTYVKMTIDALLCYTNLQPLAHIPIKPKLKNLTFKSFFHLRPYDPFYKKSNVLAALKIQRAYRQHRAIKIVARMRNEMWVRSAASHNNLIHHLADTSMLTKLGYDIATVFLSKLNKTMKFQEIQHHYISTRLINLLKRSNEHKQLQEEFQSKYKERINYLQKKALLQNNDAGDDYFVKGYEMLTTSRQIKLLAFVSYGLCMTGRLNMRDMFGRRGIDVLGKRKAMVTGLKRHVFTQFAGSPHVRYHKMSIYQGEWTGIPLFTPLLPHGEGLIMFFEAWGIARENKVLYVTIIGCNNLVVGDITGTSDPYCEVSCNNVTIKSSTKYRTLNPVYNETFEIDVTNPGAYLHIIIKDHDLFGQDSFLGQVRLPLSDYVDGLEHKHTLPLKSEDLYSDKIFDNGDIEVKIYWTERKYDDDLIYHDEQLSSTIRLQCWIRRILAKCCLIRLQTQRRKFLRLIKKRAVQITNTCRIRLARKELRRRQRQVRSAIKIQKRIRIFISKRYYMLLQYEKRQLIVMQKYMRRYLARKVLVKLKHAFRMKRHMMATRVQRICRGHLIRIKNIIVPKDHDIISNMNPMITRRLSVHDWLITLGYDASLGLRRSNRIIDRMFKKMLSMQFMRFVSRYGIVYLHEYPPSSYEEAEGDNIASGLNNKDFVSMYLPCFRTVGYHRHQAIQLIHQTPYTIICQLSSCISKSESVAYTIITIQCAYRQYRAKKTRRRMKLGLKSLIKFQRLFRRKHKRFYKAAYTIQCLYRVVRAKLRVRHMKREYNSAVIIQSSYRCHLARLAIMNKRSVDRIVILKCSSFVPKYEPQKCFEFRDSSFWMSDSPDFAELRVEFEAKECISSVWIMTSTYSASPQYVSISAVINKHEQRYETFIEHRYLPLVNGPRWHKLKLPGIVAKFFRIAFYESYGDEKHISVRQIRFIRSQEVSTKIEVEPEDIIRHDGPIPGQVQAEKLSIIATGWPTPSYQWYRNNKPVHNATSPDYLLQLQCLISSRTRTYRCLKCKMVTRDAPFNAYRVQCENCQTKFTFKELLEYERSLDDIMTLEYKCVEKRDKYNANIRSIEKLQQINPMNTKYPHLIRSYHDNINRINSKLRKLKEERYFIKNRGEIHHVNKYRQEGIYHCVVNNIRGGNIRIQRVSRKVVVVFEYAKYFPLKVYPFYYPRPQLIRKRWSTYSSIFGTLNKGRIEGMVVIHYGDGSFYEGPYVGEEWLDNRGQVQLAGRVSNHYGVYKCPDGRIFEGQYVDNHFDQYNIQSFYKLTLPTGDIYEGTFCDEQFHGHGLYYYTDGSVYEGQWHRGSQFGHGHYRSSEGWVYEGYFDDNRRHGQGCISWPDGSMYAGLWYYEMIQGKGVFITKLRDIFKGELMNGLYHGYGEMVYGDGARYTGSFMENQRHGKGIFCDSDGSEYYGNYLHDEKDGEFIVKLIVPIEEANQPNYEIRIGIYENGTFIRWKSKFSNESATKTFIRLFRENKEMFDSMFSMILARSLPNLPEGIDPKNKQVQDIIIKIRGEAGSLVGSDALIQAQKSVDDLLRPIAEHEHELLTLKESYEMAKFKITSFQNEIQDHERKYQELMREAESVTLQMEQMWLDDSFHTRERHHEIVQQLTAIPSEEWFKFKNQRTPPVFTKKIMDTICNLLRLPLDWDSQKLLLSDSIYNRTAVASNNNNSGKESNQVPTDKSAGSIYDCKLVFLLSEYDVNRYLTIEPNHHDIDLILSDPRFRYDSYYIESLGSVAPHLVQWIKSNHAYVQTARSMLPLIKRCEKYQIEASRVKHTYHQKQEDLSSLQGNREITKRNIYKQELEISDMNEGLIRANYMLKFIEDSFSYTQEQLHKVDVYKLLEEKIEKNKEKFIIDTCMNQMITDVVQRHDDEKQMMISDAHVLGREYVELHVDQPMIEIWMKDEIQAQQLILSNNGYDLGYGYDDDKAINVISEELTYQNIISCAEVVITKLNEAYHESDITIRKWKSLSGKIFTSRFIYILTWKFWKEIIIARREDEAVIAWENIFGSIENCAQNAIEAKINHFFSSTAKRQAIIWAKHHPDDIIAMEKKLSGLFEANYMDEVAIKALEISQDIKSKARSVTERASCICWIKYHHDIYEQAKDDQSEMMSEMFAKEFPDNTAEECFKILNNIANPTEMLWSSYADHWKAFHVQQYEATAQNIIEAMAKDFITSNPILTHVEAAKIIENHAIARYINNIDMDTANQYMTYSTNLFNATCYGMRYQGYLRKGRISIQDDHKHEAEKMWISLSEATSNFQLGSCLFLSEPEKEHHPISSPSSHPTSPHPITTSSYDSYHDFRMKLIKKYAWLYGYLHKHHDDICDELKQIEHKNPFHHIHHNYRPSEEEQIRRKLEHEYMTQKRQVANMIVSVMDRIATWNTYFGMKKNDENDHDGHDDIKHHKGSEDEGHDDNMNMIEEGDETEDFAEGYDPHTHDHHQLHHNHSNISNDTSSGLTPSNLTTRSRTPPSHHLQSPLTLSNHNITTPSTIAMTIHDDEHHDHVSSYDDDDDDIE